MTMMDKNPESEQLPLRILPVEPDASDRAAYEAVELDVGMNLQSKANLPGQLLVYLATCIPTGLRYVGIIYGRKQTIARRWRTHCKPSSAERYRRLERAIQQFGPDAFTVGAIDDAENLDELRGKEKTYVFVLDTFRNGY